MSHLEKSIHIRAPLGRVYNFAHDPHHWNDWYVGISEEKEFTDERQPRRYHYLMVGTPFPLTQIVRQDWLVRQQAKWEARHDRSAQCTELGDDCELLLLASDQEWTLEAENGETTVTVSLDFTVPVDLLDQPSDQRIVEELEASCLERTLLNLKRLCETLH